jgi:ABC-type multidrug transport system fused ATPase/permease subunit
MRFLFRAILKCKKHLILGVFTMLSLFVLTVANQMEMLSLGFLANSGSDFFLLFGHDKQSNSVSLKEVQEQWKKIDSKGSGSICKGDAALYMAKHKKNNPVTNILNKISAQFNLQENFLHLMLLLASVAIFKALWQFISRYLTQVLAICVSRDLRQHYFEHIQFLPLSFYHEYNMGALTSRSIGDASQISASLNSCIVNYLQTPFTFVTTLMGCFYLSWQLSLIIFIGLPLVLFPIVVFTKKIKKVSRQLQKNQESFTSVLLDFLGGIQIVKIFSMEKVTRDKYKEQNDRMAYLECKNAKYAHLTRPVLHLVTTGCMITVVIFGLYFLKMTVAQLIVFVGLLYLCYEPIKRFADENGNIQKGVVAAERMFQVLELKTYAKEEGGESISGFVDCIEFDNVSFKYGDNLVLKGVSFKVKKGESVAIVGPTGSGKTTLVQLLPRLFDVYEGEIRIDGIPINTYSLKSLRENISFVPQRPFLFFDTIAENICFGNDFSQEEIIKAAKQAHAHEFIKELSKGYDTVIAETGKSLSGGEQQRLAIARALIKKAPILVMDEATASLDAISESKIRLMMRQLHGKVTQIIIAHRLSMLEYADRIIYISNGMKLAEGTKEELLKTSEEFKAMWDSFHNLAPIS